MFDEYAKKLEALGENVPKEFENMAKRGAIHFQNTAVQFTDAYKKVDTGAYKRSWNGDTVIDDDKYTIICQNTMEYASYLEDGYEIKKEHFVPFEAGSGVSKRTGKAWKTKGMQGTPKTTAFINSYKAKYPNAKGFIAKPRRFTGLKIGRQSVKDLRGWIKNQFDILIKRASMNK